MTNPATTPFVLLAHRSAGVRRLLFEALRRESIFSVGTKIGEDMIGMAQSDLPGAIIVGSTLDDGDIEQFLRRLLADERTRQIPVFVFTGADLPDMSSFTNVLGVFPSETGLQDLLAKIREILAAPA